MRTTKPSRPTVLPGAAWPDVICRRECAFSRRNADNLATLADTRLSPLQSQASILAAGVKFCLTGAERRTIPIGAAWVLKNRRIGAVFSRVCAGGLWHAAPCCRHASGGQRGVAGLQINGRETEADVKSLSQLAKHVLRGTSRLKLAQEPSFAPILLTEVITHLWPDSVHAWHRKCML